MPGLFDPPKPTELEPYRVGLERALEYAGGTHTVEDVYGLLLAGKAMLWSKGDSCIITEIYEYPRKRVLNFWLATGEREALYELVEMIVDWGEQVGCDYATFAGRRGWGRANLHEAWEPKLTYFTRRLNG